MLKLDRFVQGAGCADQFLAFAPPGFWPHTFDLEIDSDLRMPTLEQVDSHIEPYLVLVRLGGEPPRTAEYAADEMNRILVDLAVCVLERAHRSQLPRIGMRMRPSPEPSVIYSP